MASTIGALTVACAAACLPWSVQAAPVTLNFQPLLVSVDHAPVPSPFQGFGFSGAVTAYKNNYLGLTTQSGAAVFSNSLFTINVNGQSFDTVSFDGGTSAGSITATAFSSSGSKLGEGGPGGFTGTPYWDTKATTLGSFATLIDHVSFTATQFFSIDNITFSLSTDTGGAGGSVPEPAGFGLVALALAGAGATSRRRKRA